ncbi:MAG: response regulator [Reichenbachiella sp.]
MSHFSRSILVLLLVLLNPAISRSQASIVPEDILGDQPAILNEYLSIVMDSTASWSIRDILTQDLFKEGKPVDQVSFASRTTTFWGKLSFHNKTQKVGLYYLFVGKNDFIDAYFVRNGTVIDHHKSGYLYPAEDKSIVRGGYYIPLNIGPESHLDIILKIREKIHKDPEFDIILSSPKQFGKTVLNKQLVDFIFQGIFWVMVIYSLFLYFISKQRAYLYYTGYLLSVSISFLFLSGLLREFFISNHPQWTIYFMPAILVVSTLYWAFTIDFLDIKKEFKSQYPYVKLVLLINIVLVMSTTLYLLLTQDIGIPTSLTRYTVIANLLGILLFLILNRTSKHPMFKYYVMGAGVVGIFTLFETLTWDPNSSVAGTIRFGVVIEMGILSFALVQKRKLSDKRNKQALDKEIELLKMSESLSQWQKEELEKIIDNRTEKINNQNSSLKRAIKKANQAARVKSDFLSVMSHEIRTPMNAVIGTIHLLLSENPMKYQLSNLKTLKFSAENLLILLNDILDYSKFEAGKIKLENIPFDLRELTKAIGNAHEIDASEHGVNFNILIDHKIPSSLKGDPARITQVLNNLISNAIKFSPNGQVRLLINLIKKKEESVKIEFRVEDSGIGISQDKIEFIFDSFTQAYADTSRKFGGTGLGLAITKKLVHLFDSKIFVESEIGKGSSFYFSLILESNKHPIELSIVPPATQTAELSDKRVLVVDDNKINLMMAQKFVQKWNMKCDTVLSGKEALESIFNHDYDIILMDLQMPDMDGYETSKTIRKLDNEQISNIPIVAVSADTFENVQNKIFRAGIDDFLSKPFNPSDLLSIIQKHINTEHQNK